jgi:hypothetical protein
MRKQTNLAQISKVMHAARLTIDGSFKSQRQACLALEIPPSQSGRVSDAHTILMHGIPELVAAVESGQLAFQTGWHIAQRIPPDQQLAFINQVLANGERHGRETHGIYTGRGRYPTPQQFRVQHRAHDRVCEAVDKLLDAIVERTDALGVCTAGTRPAPEPEQGRKWRIVIRRCRKALGKLEQRIDWTKTQNAKLVELEAHPIGEGDRHNDSNIDSNDNGSEDDGSGPQD